jgi:hypothetical protein
MKLDQCNDRMVRRNLLVRVPKLDEQWTVFEGDTPILESVSGLGLTQVQQDYSGRDLHYL